MSIDFISSSCSSFDKEVITSDATVLDITPVSRSSFIDSVRLRSMDRALVRLAFEVPNRFAISSRVNFSEFSF